MANPALGMAGAFCTNSESRIILGSVGGGRSRPPFVPSLRDSIILPAYPGLTSWANVFRPWTGLVFQIC